MNEETPPSQTLAERALQRLRRIATGNGIEPVAITVLQAEEQLFTLKGTMDVSPLCETESVSYFGGVRGKGRKTLGTFAALAEAVALHKKEFNENPDWIEATIEEIKHDASQGWGLENAKVTLPQKSAIYAATENCPSCGGRQLLTCAQCNGQGTVTCTQCQGQGRELCYYCGGRGEDPQQPGQKCHTCEGTRYAPCRFCKTLKYLPCPTCQGRRGTPCPTCHATGKTTQDVTVTCGASSHFRLISDGLPSGLRRGLERIGIANLGKGHADITAAPPPQETEKPKEGAPIKILLYQAVLPYAELRMGFGDKKAIVSVLGKRCAISGVPNFLDDTLMPWRNKLHQAALGKAPLNEAMEARAINEILSLTVAGKGRLEEIRKLYPFGLSAQAINAILSDMQLALNRTTLKTRAVIAVLCVLFCAFFFYGLFVMGIETHLTIGRGTLFSICLTLVSLAAALMASWMVLNFSTRFVIKRRFPQLKLALQQKIGKTGYSMIAGIVIAFITMITLSPFKPLWLLTFMR